MSLHKNPSSTCKLLTFAIATDANMTAEQWKEKMEWTIRRENASHPKSRWIIYDNSRAENFLREIGVSPSRIVIYHLSYNKYESKYKSEQREFKTPLELEKELIVQCTHLIAAKTTGEGIVHRCLNHLKK